MNCIIMGWVNLAMGSILEGMFDIPHEEVLFAVGLTLLLTAGYSALSGLWGVAITDAFQFTLAMIGCIVLAFVVLSLPQVGGMAGIQSQLPAWTFQFTPVISNDTVPSAGGALAMTMSSFLAFIGIQWWASWYPGAEPGGGGFVAQRMMSAKNEKHSLFATLWFTIAHYCIRPWPWIIVGLASLILYPDLPPDQKRLGYVYAMRDYLPVGLKGLLVASFLAAYMSTVSTQLNWGSSYMINDVYKRFISPDASEKALVRISRISTFLIMGISMITTLYIQTISGAWTFIIEAGAGLGLVLIVRWFWWRVNAWSELSAMITPLFLYWYLQTHMQITFPDSLFIIVGGTTIIWIAVTFLTPPTSASTLHHFYRTVHPGGIGWKKIQQALPDVQPDRGMGYLFLCWILGVILVYSMLFGIGKVLLSDFNTGILLIGAGVLCGIGINFFLTKQHVRIME
jgi:Na+/proline symporter